MSLLNLFHSARDAIADWRRREKAYGELMALDDRTLADIGIRRSEIRAIVEGTYALRQSATPKAERPARAGRPARVPFTF